MEFKKVVNDIRSLKIQGAEAIAKQSVRALYHIIHKSKTNNPKELLSELRTAQEELVGSRPTEPCMRNALQYVLHNINKQDLVQLVKDLDVNIKYAQQYFDAAEKTIAEIGSRKIHERCVVFTHCHSSTVMMILAKAKFAGKNFTVHNTETRPLFQGRKTAKELSALGIPVSHYVDSAARMALKKADVVLFGADAIQSDGKIINKIGTELFLEVAERYDIPCYSCAISWKFDPLTIYGIDEPIENRQQQEIWENPPKKVTVMNPAFEVIDPKIVTGVISELGVFRPEVFIDEVRRTQPWMF